MAELASMDGGLSTAELDLMRAVEDDHWWYRALRSHVLKTIRVPQSQFDLLDAGCGSGGVLAKIREKFPSASLSGLDLSEHALRLSEARKTGARLVQGSVDRLPFDDETFDLVTSLDVLYHRDVNDRIALRETHRVLRSGGQIIINLPAFEFLRGSHDVAINTARRYTRPALARMLQEAGFTIEKLTYWNMTLLPAIAAIRWLSRARLKSEQAQSDLASPPSEMVNSILTWLAQSELALSRQLALPFGTSLFAIARK